MRRRDLTYTFRAALNGLEDRFGPCIHAGPRGAVMKPFHTELLPDESLIGWHLARLVAGENEPRHLEVVLIGVIKHILAVKVSNDAFAGVQLAAILAV